MDKCIACNGVIKKDGKIEGYIQGTFYEVYSCEKCQTKFADPHKVDTVVYEYIYKNSADAPGYMRYHQYADEVLNKRNPLRWLASQEHVYYGVVQNLPRKGRVLEVGCGLGYFTYALAKSGYDVQGIDVSHEAVAEANRRYGDYFSAQDFFEMSSGQYGLYDAVIMVELIEHVEDPERYLSHAQSLLTTDGVVIVTTPNRSWYGNELVLWASDLPPVHLTWFSELGLTTLSERLGYKARLASFSKFNLLHGSIVGPSGGAQVNPPFFTSEGEPLFSKFVHSKMYYLTRKLRVYESFKNLIGWKNRVLELGDWFIGGRNLSIKQASCMCVILKRTDI